MAELRKVTMNFYAVDIAHFERAYGQGWSGEIREIIHRHVVRELIREHAKWNQTEDSDA